MDNGSLPSLDLLEETARLEDNLERAVSLFPPPPFLASAYPSLLMWGGRYSYCLARRGNTSFVLSVARGEVYAPLPPAPFTRESAAAVFECLAAANGPGPGLSRIEGLDETQARQAGGWGWAVRHLADEYLYDLRRCAALSGDGFRDRRNEMNRLLKRRTLTERPLLESDLQGCGLLFDKWKDARSRRLDAVGARMLGHAEEAHRRLLKNLEAWGLQGSLLLKDGHPAAYTVSGPLSPGTLGVYVEVADPDLMGAGTAVFVGLCRKNGAYQFVNTGDAQFLPGLQAAKESWHPVKRLARWAMEPKGNE